MQISLLLLNPSNPELLCCFINTSVFTSMFKMSRIPDNFDSKTLYNELKSAIHEDKMYWVRNDAKIRACMTSQSYDEFRDIVAAAHLSSLDKNDKIKIGERVWNSHAAPKHTE